MEALQHLRERLKKEKPFAGLKIGLALHITKETGILVRTLRDGGAKVALCSCNPLSTQDDIAAALKTEQDVQVYGHKGENKQEYYEYMEKVLEFCPNLVIDDGCDLVTGLHTHHQDKIKDVIGGCEETTTGVQRLRAMESDGVLPFPMIAVNDNKTKHLMDNLYGTGQSTLDGVLRATNILIAGKTAVVAGYGSCGKGVAMRLKGHGANVIVTEVDPFPALQAMMDGFRVIPMMDAAPLGDIFLTVTGDTSVLTLKHVQRMKDGAILANSGHFDCEIAVDEVRSASKSTRLIRPMLEEFTLEDKTTKADGPINVEKKIFILAEGRLVNLAAAEGHPSEVMSMSFCGQVLACEYLVKNHKNLAKQVYSLPPEVDTHIAQLQLDARSVKIDELTPEQKAYLGSWKAGT